jgi:hypothetical protein
LYDFPPASFTVLVDGADPFPDAEDEKSFLDAMVWFLCVYLALLPAMWGYYKG